jgi:hypothetical protein
MFYISFFTTYNYNYHPFYYNLYTYYKYKVKQPFFPEIVKWRKTPFHISICLLFSKDIIDFVKTESPELRKQVWMRTGLLHKSKAEIIF